MVRFFNRHSIPFVLRSTLKIENFNDFLDKNTQITDILYLGGDVYINYLINNVDLTRIKQNIYLAKSGSGNDFLRSLSRINSGSITIGEAVTNQGTRRFINGAGIGIDSLVCHYVDSDAKKNKLSYFINFFRAIIKYHRKDFTVTVDGVKHEYHKGYFVAVQNGKFFGGGMKVAPNANITNDDFVICVAHNLNSFIVQILFMTIYMGVHKYIKKRIDFLKGKEISIKVSEPYYFQTDGELTESVDEITIKKALSKEFYAFKKSHFKNSIFKKFRSK